MDNNNNEMLKEINQIKSTVSLIVLGMAGSGKTTFVKVNTMNILYFFD